MPPDKEIIELLYARRKQHGGWNSEWYAGVASDPRERLFKHHRVDEASGAWAFERVPGSQPPLLLGFAPVRPRARFWGSVG